MKTYNNYFIDSFLFEKAVNEWCSEATIKAYCSSFNHFINNFHTNNPEKYTTINFKRFLWELFIKYKWTSFTYNRNRKNLKVFCDFLVKEKFIKQNPLEEIKDRKVDKVNPKFLNKRQIFKLKNTLDKIYPNSDFFSQRNKTIVYFFLYSWVRFSELLNLKIQDINFMEANIRVKRWKGWKERLIPLVSPLANQIVNYYFSRSSLNLKSDYLFISWYDKQMTNRNIYNIFSKINESLDFHFTPHMCRHTFATELVRKNINIYNISRILWHSRLDTTKIYLNLDVENLKKSLDSVSLYSYSS